MSHYRRNHGGRAGGDPGRQGVEKDTAWDALAESYTGLGGPVVVYNKSHSGSRLVARLLAEAGIFMGAHRNESEDSLDVLALVEHLVGRHYPDYATLWSSANATHDALRVARDCFDAHLTGFDRASRAPWGWKLCESGYALPVLARIFPRMRVVHLVRDGRDVAFCDHRAPDDAFWRKIHFDTDRIATWRGMRLTGPSYRRRSHLYNAVHWSNSVRVGRLHGAMLGERYMEIRYEDLCSDFAASAARMLHFVGAPDPAGAVARVAPLVRLASVGKHRRAPARALQEVVAIAKQELLGFGYLEHDGERPRRSLRYSRFADDLVDRARRRMLLASWRRYLPWRPLGGG